jgi:hypothetical protein
MTTRNLSLLIVGVLLVLGLVFLFLNVKISIGISITALIIMYNIDKFYKL